MHNAIQISKLNDFIFSPKSIFYHAVYESFSELLYHDMPQTVGRIAHENIDQKKYSSSKRYVQGKSVYSSKYNLVGKIDLYDTKDKVLIERKFHVKKVYDGYLMQLYAQMFCIQEEGFEVNGLKIHSLKDNKRYSIPLPTKKEIKKFEMLINNIRSFDPIKDIENISQNKLDNCIYKVFYA